jgi:hypothetical protein
VERPIGNRPHKSVRSIDLAHVHGEQGLGGAKEHAAAGKVGIAERVSKRAVDCPLKGCALASPAVKQVANSVSIANLRSESLRTDFMTASFVPFGFGSHLVTLILECENSAPKGSEALIFFRGSRGAACAMGGHAASGQVLSAGC